MYVHSFSLPPALNSVSPFLSLVWLCFSFRVNSLMKTWNSGRIWINWSNATERSGSRMLINMDTMSILVLILSRLRFLKDLIQILRLVSMHVLFLPLFCSYWESSNKHSFIYLWFFFFFPEIRLASARSATLEDDVASISGRPFSDSGSSKVLHFPFITFRSFCSYFHFNAMLFVVCSTLGNLPSLLMNQLLIGKMKDLWYLARELLKLLQLATPGFLFLHVTMLYLILSYYLSLSDLFFCSFSSTSQWNEDLCQSFVSSFSVWFSWWGLLTNCWGNVVYFL